PSTPPGDRSDIDIPIDEWGGTNYPLVPGHEIGGRRPPALCRPTALRERLRDLAPTALARGQGRTTYGDG
ncbi:MAG: hypothetical protein L0I24_21875, partial [Pseudonocardia sp.]|nr:hypothetical protein [Pseudonocardia sp.]